MHLSLLMRSVSVVQVRTAASYALGSMAVGSLSDFLPFMVKEISMQPRRQYLLLNSLKDVIRWVFISMMWLQPKNWAVRL